MRACALQRGRRSLEGGRCGDKEIRCVPVRCSEGGEGNVWLFIARRMDKAAALPGEGDLFWLIATILHNFIRIQILTHASFFIFGLCSLPPTFALLNVLRLSSHTCVSCD